MIVDTPWPSFDEKYLIEDEVELPIQVNGKLRSKIVVQKDATREQVEELARNSPEIIKWTEGATIKKVVVVPGKLVNIVLGH